MSRRDTQDGYPRLTVAIVRGLESICRHTVESGPKPGGYSRREKRDAVLAADYVKCLAAFYRKDGRL